MFSFCIYELSTFVPIIFFFFKYTATTEIYTLSLHDALPISALESGMWLLGCTYNLCWPHHELSRRAAKAQGVRGEVLLTPAMASGLTDHVWSVKELLSYRVAPAPWVAPKRRGRPAKQTELHESLQQSWGEQVRRRPLLRLRKGVLCSTTS